MKVDNVNEKNKCTFCKKEYRIKLVPLLDNGKGFKSCVKCKRLLKKQLKELKAKQYAKGESKDLLNPNERYRLNKLKQLFKMEVRK